MTAGVLEILQDHLADCLETLCLITGEAVPAKGILLGTAPILRRTGLFLPINCSALAENLLESRLFGHERAALRVPLPVKEGGEQTIDGTLFLDKMECHPRFTYNQNCFVCLREGSFEQVSSTRTAAFKRTYHRRHQTAISKQW